jgi:hypothetical protein
MSTKSYSMVFAYGVASKCYLLITPITLLLLIPTVRAISVHGSATINGGREERPPPPKRDGGGMQGRRRCWGCVGSGAPSNNQPCDSDDGGGGGR